MKSRILRLTGVALGAVILLGTSGCAHCWTKPYFGVHGGDKRHVPKEVRAEVIAPYY